MAPTEEIRVVAL